MGIDMHIHIPIARETETCATNELYDHYYKSDIELARVSCGCSWYNSRLIKTAINKDIF